MRPSWDAKCALGCAVCKGFRILFHTCFVDRSWQPSDIHFGFGPWTASSAAPAPLANVDVQAGLEGDGTSTPVKAGMCVGISKPDSFASEGRDRRDCFPECAAKEGKEGRKEGRQEGFEGREGGLLIPGSWQGQLDGIASGWGNVKSLRSKAIGCRGVHAG